MFSQNQLLLSRRHKHQASQLYLRRVFLPLLHLVLHFLRRYRSLAHLSRRELPNQHPRPVPLDFGNGLGPFWGLQQPLLEQLFRSTLFCRKGKKRNAIVISSTPIINKWQRTTGKSQITTYSTNFISLTTSKSLIHSLLDCYKDKQTVNA